MFRNPKDVNGKTMVKSSVVRSVRTKLIEVYPTIESSLDEILPKKATLVLAKTKERISLYLVDGNVLFFQHFDDQLIPSLRILHQFPNILPKVQVDRGAIKFVLSGANIMCPGLTSPGAWLPEEPLPVGSIVAVMAEGKEHALAIGITKMSTDEMKSLNKGIGVDLIHFLGDPLWRSSID
ncbi:Translation machinery-associated protein 20 [Smittium mucronatum]|uniref:Translation machinery-associated protein 20 n=1 Tax=Smittium mucronatum TaxID=133383 RepID=A0A1R0GN45_9FUNG|nr:Translation machinery-associated protein 20 [Smittium mucronatum]